MSPSFYFGGSVLMPAPLVMDDKSERSPVCNQSKSTTTTRLNSQAPSLTPSSLHTPHMRETNVGRHDLCGESVRARLASSCLSVDAWMRGRRSSFGRALHRAHLLLTRSAGSAPGIRSASVACTTSTENEITFATSASKLQRGSCSCC